MPTYEVNSITWNYTLSGTNATIGTGSTIQGNATTSGIGLSDAITIPSTVGTQNYPVTGIGQNSFNGCTNLTSITIPDSVTTIGNQAFISCTNLTSVTIPNLVTTIDSYAFYNCAKLTSINIPDSVTTIGTNCFNSTSASLVVTMNTGKFGITVPSSNKSFFGNTSVDFVVPPPPQWTDTNGITWNYTLSGTSPDQVASIGAGTATAGNATTSGISLSGGITIPSTVGTNYTVTGIGQYAFFGCSGLTSITIPDSVTTIGILAFYGCNGLTSINIPDSVTTIGASSFTNTHADLIVTMNTKTISGTNYTSPTTDIAFFGNPSVTLVVPPPPVPFVTGKVPNWLQPTSGQYTATMGGYESQFGAWCSPTTAANQLGHLVDHGGVTQPTNINDGTDAGNDSPVALVASTIAWDSGYGWGDYMLDGPTYRGKNLFNGVVTDFGWHMNTNNLGPLGTGAGSAVGSTLQNIYNGMTDFYQQVGYTNMVGMVYHFNGSVTTFGPDPAFWTANGHTAAAGVSADYAITLATIKHEIDNNRTVMACFNGWSITHAGHAELTGMTSTEDETGTYQTLGAYDSAGPHGEQFNIASTDGGNVESYNAGLGHTVLIVGYIPAGATQDPTGTTNWLVVRDNFTTTHKNVLIPFADLSKLLATIYVNHTTATYSAITVGGPDYGYSYSETLFIPPRFTLDNSNNYTNINYFKIGNVSTTESYLANKMVFTDSNNVIHAIEANNGGDGSSYIINESLNDINQYTWFHTFWEADNIAFNVPRSLAPNSFPPPYNVGDFALDIHWFRMYNSSGLTATKFKWANGGGGNGDTGFGGSQAVGGGWVPGHIGIYGSNEGDETSSPHNINWTLIEYCSSPNPNAAAYATQEVAFTNTTNYKQYLIHSNYRTVRNVGLEGINSGDTTTTLTFDTNTLTIENSITTTDTDAVDFVLPAGYEMNDMSVTNFVGTGGTGTITYTLATGGTTVTTGTFTAIGTNLLTGNLLVASADTTYTLTLTANAAITYTIVGTSLIIPTPIAFVANILTVQDTDPDRTSFVLPAGYEMASLNVTSFGGSGTATYSLTGGSTDITGTFTATGTNILNVNIVAESADTEYVLLITADPGITYTIVGTKSLDYAVSTPTPVAFSTNIITIENSIDATDTDAVSFVIPVGYEMNDLSVTSFNQTTGTGGIITYTVDISGGSTVATGTFTAIGDNLLLGNLLVGSATPFVLSLTADATIVYTIVGTKTVDYIVTPPTPVAFSNNVLTIENNISATDTDAVSFVIPVGYEMNNLTVTNFVAAEGTINGTITYTITTGGTTVKTGTITAIDVNLLTGTLLTSAIGSTYELALTSSAPIAYTIVGTKSVDLGIIVTTYGDWGTEVTGETYRTETKVYDGVGGINYANAVAMYGDYMMVGAPNEANTGSGRGSVYIYKRDSTTGWPATHTAKLEIAYVNGSEGFGCSIAINENYMVVGAYYDGVGGAAYIFEQDDSGDWKQKLRITPSTTLANARFGESVAINGNYIVVGTLGDNSSSPGGAAYIYELSGETWGTEVSGQIYRTETKKIYPSVGTPVDRFGVSVAINGNYIIVGAREEDSNGTDQSNNNSDGAGAAYLFERDIITGWPTNETKYLKAPTPQSSGKFGSRTAITENYIVITEYGRTGGGAAYIYERDSTTGWPDTPTKQITAGDASASAFGSSVAMNENRIVIGANISKTAYIFDKDPSTGWPDTATSKLLPLVDATEFGWSVAMHENYIGIGAPTGYKAYVFEQQVFETLTPTTLVFSNNVLTIENVTSTTDTDIIDFVLPSGYNVPELNVTNFNVSGGGSGNVSYTLATGGNTVASGSFSALSSNLLPSGFPIFALSTDVTYSLTITADTVIGYTIVGTRAVTNLSSFSITQLLGSGFTEQQLIDVGKWNADSNANHLDPTYINGFLDISGGNVTVSGSILMDTGDIDLHSHTFTQPYTYDVDLYLNNRLFVVGDVSMGDASLNVVGDMSINGKMSVGSYKPASISGAAVIPGSGYSTSGTTTTFTADIAYTNKIEFNGDISLNPITTYFGPNTTLKANTGIQFPDTTTLSTTNKESNGTTFKASTFNNMTVIGDFASNPLLTPSDYRIKTNVETLDETHTVDNLRPVKYLQTQTGKNDIGFLAHELQEHYPELVEGEKDGETMQSVNYSGLLPILINEVQQLKKQIAETRARIQTETP